MFTEVFLFLNVFSAKEKEIPETPDDNSVDIGVVRYLLGELQPKTFKAKEEDQNTCQKLMPSFTEEEIAEVCVIHEPRKCFLVISCMALTCHYQF